jgi:plastocyanin
MTRAYLPWVIIVVSSVLTAQDATVRGLVNVVHSKDESSNSGVVVWLTEIRATEIAPAGSTRRLLQKDKRFTPHVIAITVGTAIEFPNQDPFFHDVFSIYHGRPFDLGLYESGTVRKVRFYKPGVSYIFCNIHPDMSAVVVTLSTRHFTITARDGNFRIPHVTPGQYRLEVWYEHASESELASVSREVEIPPGENALATITLHALGTSRDHLNKYGEPYPFERPAKY